jgi:hypothetical protein
MQGISFLKYSGVYVTQLKYKTGVQQHTEFTFQERREVYSGPLRVWQTDNM